MTNWHESPLMIVKSADPTIHDGASLKKMLNEIEALLVNGYTLKSITECNGEIFAFLLNESELRGIGRTAATEEEEEE
jgi:hypothetical protein